MKGAESVENSKIKIKQAIVVEGKYDKIKLSEIIDGVIIVTNGFGIYSDKETIDLIRFYAKERGLVILTDSDSAGNQIRGHIKSIVPEGRVINVYVPEIRGKEKRKVKPSKEGMLGVEGIPSDVIRNAFVKAGLLENEISKKSLVTKMDFYELGLSGKSNSTMLRKMLAEKLDLPIHLSSSALRDAVNTMFDREDFISFFADFYEEIHK